MAGQTRRGFMRLLAAASAVPLFSTVVGSRAMAADQEKFTVTHTEAEWHKVLSDAQYNVLRDHGTERSGTSPLEAEERAGVYYCAGCELPLYDAKTKFHSGTGWPSFWDHLPDAVATTTDYKIGLPRTEVHCHRCGGHLGHVFDDGPQPTGLRYCMNGVALKFAVKEG